MYIIMGIQEEGSEARWGDESFVSEAAAYQYLEDHPAPDEWRSVWVEELRDKSYYADRWEDAFNNDSWDFY